MPKKKIVIDGIIGWDIYGSKMRRMLKEADGEELEIEISSPGGFVYDGIEIFNLIRDYSRNQAKVTTKLIGLAASMASYIALAGDELIAEDNAVFMIHNVWGFVIGDYQDMNKTAKEFEGLTNLLAKQYAKKSGKSLKTIRELMDDETFYYGEEAKEAGFVDEIIEGSGENSEIIEDEDKEIAESLAKQRVNNMFESMQKSEKYKRDIEKAAAWINTINSLPENTKKIDKIETAKKAENNKQSTTTIVDKPKMEVKMDLTKLLSENPEAKAEYEKNISNAKAEGQKKAIENHKKNTDAVKNILNSKEYPDTIKEKALKVITGEASLDNLNAMVEMCDFMRAEKTSLEAKDDSADIKDTHANSNDLPNAKGEVESELDFKAEIARIKGAK